MVKSVRSSMFDCSVSSVVFNERIVSILDRQS